MGQLGIVIKADGTVPFDGGHTDEVIATHEKLAVHGTTPEIRDAALKHSKKLRADNEVVAQVLQWLRENHPAHTVHLDGDGRITHAHIPNWNKP